MSTTRQQAEEVECSFFERRDHLAILAKKEIGNGGLDPAEIQRRKLRLMVLRDAAKTLYQMAEEEEAAE